MAYNEYLTEDQRRMLKRRIETLTALEQEVGRLGERRARRAARRQGLEAAATATAGAGALSTFHRASDWQGVSERAAAQFGRAPRLTWEMLKKAVAEEDKYQSKKNWSSTKGRGNRKAPVARRLDAESLKKLGVYPQQQFPVLAQCDTCGRQINAHYLKDHQEINCAVSTSKRASAGTATATATAAVPAAGGQTREVASGAKRAADRDGTEEPGAKMPRLTKKERVRQEKERREREREERRLQQRAEKERKKREREEKREREQTNKAKQPLDLDRQCGVVAEPGAAPCSRSLTCKTHSMAMKRAVVGRSNMFDALLQAHLAKSRSAAAAKSAASRSQAARSTNAAAVRNATAIALGGGAGVLDESFFEDSDPDRGSDSEAERVIDGIRCSRGRPMARRPTMLPRRRHHYLRVRDLFYDALRPSMPPAAEASERA
ncbi:SAGA complex subunit Sgf73 [Coemansia sp. RSA 552]|nr:SAGA complex subunit Sgf73 [Coemansia sp. RSA 552]